MRLRPMLQDAEKNLKSNNQNIAVNIPLMSIVCLTVFVCIGRDTLSEGFASARVATVVNVQRLAGFRRDLRDLFILASNIPFYGFRLESN